MFTFHPRYPPLVAALVLVQPALAISYTLTIQGTDAIFLAGRTDLTIPDPGSSWSVLGRHSSSTPEEAKETFPQWIPVVGGDVVRVADPGVGAINFFNGYNPAHYFGPDGNGTAGSHLTSLGGISDYLGPQGPLVGVFLDDSIPNSGPAPATLNFTTSGVDALGTNFASLSPTLRQVFYIGNGVTSAGDFQEFIAPTGATRLFFGIPDGFGFGGPPGAYDDNDGSYRITVGVNQLPTASVPDGGATWAMLLGACLVLGRLAIHRRR